MHQSNFPPPSDLRTSSTPRTRPPQQHHYSPEPHKTYSQRYDRHGQLFGDKVSSRSNPREMQNGSQNTHLTNQQGSEGRTSDSLSCRRERLPSSSSSRREREDLRNKLNNRRATSQLRTPTLQWREKNHGRGEHQTRSLWFFLEQDTPTRKESGSGKPTTAATTAYSYHRRGYGRPHRCNHKLP
ncbi:unnamed protein product [Arabis nemorensis]|uniref:Uncharacterized protein n=1 Tax=Arabis nemorensis TaxID=586526 RepID=A0A565BJK4_9BRAS|nr:unnamed protein product [Arabis nemorensis]